MEVSNSSRPPSPLNVGRHKWTLGGSKFFFAKIILKSSLFLHIIEYSALFRRSFSYFCLHFLLNNVKQGCSQRGPRGSGPPPRDWNLYGKIFWTPPKNWKCMRKKNRAPPIQKFLATLLTWKILFQTLFCIKKNSKAS